jgi:hypothetical protein
MAEHKFLDSAGIGRLWKNIVRKITSSVDSERERAQQEEARLEAKINSGGTALVEGEAIDITTDENGQTVISVENNSIKDEHVESISISKLQLKNGDTLILNGGNANG